KGEWPGYARGQTAGPVVAAAECCNIFVGLGKAGILIADITDPSRPRGIGGLDTPGTVRKIALSGVYAYVADGSAGLSIIDVSDPSNPIELSRMGGIEEAVDIAVAGAHVLVGTSKWESGAFGATWEVATTHIIDVSDPRNPRQVSRFGGRWVGVSGHYAYSGTGSTGGSQVVDISDPANPKATKLWDGDTDGMWATSVTISGGFAYFGLRGASFAIADLSTPLKPVIVSRLTTNTGTIGYSVSAFGGEAYVSDEVGVSSFDVSDPANPKLLGRYDFPAPQWASSVTACFGRSVALVDSTGLSLLEGREQSPLRLVGTFNASGSSTCVALAETLAYVADGVGGLHVMDIQDPSDPKVLTTFFGTLPSVDQVSVMGSRAVAYGASSTGKGGLVALDISDPTNPRQVGGMVDEAWPRACLAVSSNLVFLGRPPGLVIYDMSDVTTLKYVGSLFQDAYPERILISGQIAYVLQNRYDFRPGLPQAIVTAQLVPVDFSDPASPMALGRYSQSGSVSDAGLSGSFIYMVGDFGLTVLTATSNPPYRLRTIATTGTATGIAVTDRYAYVRDAAGLQVYDISLKSKPVWIDGISLKGDFGKIALAGELAYLAQGMEGFQIVQVERAAIIRVATGDGRVNVRWNSLAKGMKLQTSMRLDGPFWEDVAGSTEAEEAELPMEEKRGFFRLVSP
ncbi:MAG: LVIVD repeat-containing protein, partial [Limisphaerales bacterium]